MTVDPADLAHRHEYHRPRSRTRRDQHEQVRSLTGNLALALNTLLPDGEEKQLALRRLQEVMFWGNAALACAPDPAATDFKGWRAGQVVLDEVVCVQPGHLDV